MEANIFPIPEVVSRRNQYILIELFMDGGPNKDANQQMEIDRFSTAELPFYVILSPIDQEIARFPGLSRNTEKFTKFLDRGLTDLPSFSMNK
ncbi:MAG: hypothetical protein IIA61_05080 [Candidatus Marinimicrobia bacterium]|nr:hypothetical protein [Candidatus Neomarinimicrobiota bacterium]